MATFDALGIAPALLEALAAQGLTIPTPIQAAAIPVALSGGDLVGRARTGSGKTLAFVLPVLQNRSEGAPGALVLAPTRELALQVNEVFRSVVPRSAIPLVGGTPYASQRKALARRPRVVVGTPGRLRDLVTRGDLDLSGVRTVVLDEADEMLRMGFQDDLDFLLAAVPDRRQVLLFSATMPAATQALADRRLHDPTHVQVEAEDMTVHHIEQGWMRVPAAHKLETLHLLLLDAPEGTTLVFANTRVGCVDLADQLVARGLLVERLPEHAELPWLTPADFADRYGGVAEQEVPDLLVALAFGKIANQEVEVLESRKAHWRCDCSMARIEAVLLQLGVGELTAMLQEDGQAEVTCHFCNLPYLVGPERLRELISMHQPVGDA